VLPKATLWCLAGGWQSAAASWASEKSSFGVAWQAECAWLLCRFLLTRRSCSLLGACIARALTHHPSPPAAGTALFPILWMPESLLGREQLPEKGRKRGRSTKPYFCWPPLGFIPRITWVGSCRSLPVSQPRTPAHGAPVVAVPVPLGGHSLGQELPIPSTHLHLLSGGSTLVHAGAWPPVKSSCRQLGAAPNGLPGDLCSDSSLQPLTPAARLALLGQTAQDPLTAADAGLAPFPPSIRCLQWCWGVVVPVALVRLVKPGEPLEGDKHGQRGRLGVPQGESCLCSKGEPGGGGC